MKPAAWSIDSSCAVPLLGEEQAQRYCASVSGSVILKSRHREGFSHRETKIIASSAAATGPRIAPEQDNQALGRGAHVDMIGNAAMVSCIPSTSSHHPRPGQCELTGKLTGVRGAGGRCHPGS